MNHVVPEMVRPPLLDPQDPAQGRPAPVDVQAMASQSNASVASCLEKRSVCRGRFSEKDRRDMIYQDWLEILLAWAGATVAGQDLKASASHRDQQILFVPQLLGGKALSTLEMRARQRKHFLAWANESSVQPFPVTVQVFAAYMCVLVDEGAPESKLHGAAQIQHFMRHVLGLDVDLQATKTAWIKGVLRHADALKPPRTQSMIALGIGPRIRMGRHHTQGHLLRSPHGFPLISARGVSMRGGFVFKSSVLARARRAIAASNTALMQKLAILASATIWPRVVRHA